MVICHSSRMPYFVCGKHVRFGQNLICIVNPFVLGCANGIEFNRKNWLANNRNGQCCRMEFFAIHCVVVVTARILQLAGQKRLVIISIFMAKYTMNRLVCLATVGNIFRIHMLANTTAHIVVTFHVKIRVTIYVLKHVWWTFG